MSNGLNLGSEGAVAGRSPRRSIAKRMATGHGAETDQVLENGSCRKGGKAMTKRVECQPGNSKDSVSTFCGEDQLHRNTS